MTLVVDASAILALYLEEQASEAADALLAQEKAVAPALILGEVANGLWRNHRLGRLTRAAAREALTTARDQFAALWPMDSLVEDALDLAIRHDHPAYDCFFVAFARQEGLPLVTADRRLAARLSGAADIRLLA